VVTPGTAALDTDIACRNCGTVSHLTPGSADHAEASVAATDVRNGKVTGT
jgi:hypothetical protein